MSNLPRNVIGAFVLVLACVLMAGLFLVEIPDGNREVALVAFGIALGWGGAVVQFHFGSSDGSKRKDVRPDGTPSDPVHIEEDYK